MHSSATGPSSKAFVGGVDTGVGMYTVPEYPFILVDVGMYKHSSTLESPLLTDLV